MALFTITSDLGKDNYLSAIVEGAIYSNIPIAKVVTICADVDAFDVRQASYMLKHAIPYYPAQTHHIVLCGLHNTANQQLLIAQYNNQYLYFVDNGFASLILPPATKIYAIKTTDEFVYSIGNIAKTMALAASYLLKNVAIEQITTPYTLEHSPRDISPTITDNSITAQVLFIDRFKNVVLNLTKKTFYDNKKDRAFKIVIIGKEEIKTISKTYSDVGFGRRLCFFNDAGYLEIAVRDGNAADLFGLETTSVDDIYKNVKIIFE